jgi:hypothetical protein
LWFKAEPQFRQRVRPESTTAPVSKS